MGDGEETGKEPRRGSGRRLIPLSRGNVTPGQVRDDSNNRGEHNLPSKNGVH